MTDKTLLDALFSKQKEIHGILAEQSIAEAAIKGHEKDLEVLKMKERQARTEYNQLDKEVTLAKAAAFMEKLTPPKTFIFLDGILAALVLITQAEVKETASGTVYLKYKGKKRTVGRCNGSWMFDQFHQDELSFFLYWNHPLFNAQEVNTFEISSEVFKQKAEDMLQEFERRKTRAL